jgi:hypothetical protein
MSQDSVVIDLFNRWEQVRNEGKFNLAGGKKARSSKPGKL